MTDLYDPIQLQTFVTVAQTRSFTKTAARLGIRQPTVSNHIRKLEQAVGRQLLARDTHSVTLTPDGEAMIGFAGSILAAYTPAQTYFAGPQPRGRVRLGMSDDLALTRLPEILRAFRAAHPMIDIELVVDQSGQLHRRLERSHLDLFLGKRPLDGSPGVLVRRDQLTWVGTAGTTLDPTRPLPLVLYPAPSISRTHMQAALERAGRTYRTACLSRGFNGLVAAVSAGIGISAVAASMIPTQLVPLGSEHRLPKLGQLDVVLMTNPRTADRSQVQALSQTILARASQTISGAQGAETTIDGHLGGDQPQRHSPSSAATPIRSRRQRSSV